jgi:hypothetical protein
MTADEILNLAKDLAKAKGVSYDNHSLAEIISIEYQEQLKELLPEDRELLFWILNV